MHPEASRILKTVLYHFFVDFPAIVLVAYAFYREFVRDFIFAIVTILVGLATYYTYDWAWNHKYTNKIGAISILCVWIAILVTLYTVCIVDFVKKKHKSPATSPPPTSDVDSTSAISSSDQNKV